MSEHSKRRLQEKLIAQNERITEQRRKDGVAPALKAFKISSVPYEWIPDARQLFDWVNDTFPVNTWGWFDESPDFEIIDESSSNSEEALILFRQLAEEHNLADAARVHFLWVYGPDSAFTFYLDEVIDTDILKELFETDSEFWIAEKTGKWCFIVHHEGTAHLAINLQS